MTIEDIVFVYKLSGTDRVTWHGRFHTHSSNEFELHFFIEGRGLYQGSTRSFSISPGSLVLSGPHEFHSIIPELEQAPLSWYAILFSFDRNILFDDSLMRMLESFLSQHSNFFTIETSLRLYFEELFALSRSSVLSNKEAAKYLLVSFLYRWFAQDNVDIHDKKIGQFHKNRVKESAHIDKALSFMERSIRENVRIEDIAEKLGITPEHFIRIFKQKIHMSPHQYFTRLKIEGASGLLISTSKSIGEISDWFGFENQFHFSRLFKKCVGISPLEYRRTYLQVVDFS